MLVLSAAALLLQAGTPAAPSPSAWILNCDMGAPQTGAAPALRTFRLGPRLLQEWKPHDGRYGPNLCNSFPCAVSKDGLEGTVSSASLVLTIRFDRRTGQASWRTQGASGNRRTSGPCAARPDKGGAPQ